MSSRFTHTPRRLLGAAGLVASSLVLCTATSLPALAQIPAPGDILIANSADNNLQLYSTSGTLLRTYSDSHTTTQWMAASFAPDGSLVTTANNNGLTPFINYLDSVTSAETFSNATENGDQVSDASVFADGTVAISDATSDSILLYSPSGAFLSSFPIGLPFSPDGNYVDPTTNTLWVVVPTEVGSFVYHFDESGNPLGSGPLLEPFAIHDIVTDPLNGTLWVSDATAEALVNLDLSGNVLNSYASGVISTTSVGISADGSTLFASGSASGVINEISATTGLTIGTIALTDGVAGSPDFLSVAPGAPSTAAPEPGTLPLVNAAAMACLPILGFGRWKRRSTK